MAAMRNMRDQPLSPSMRSPPIAIGRPVVSGLPLVSATAAQGRLPALTTVPAAAPASEGETDVLLRTEQTRARVFRRVPVRMPELHTQPPPQPGGSSLRCADGEIRFGSRVRTRRLQLLNKFMRPEPGRWGSWSHGRVASLNTFYNQVRALPRQSHTLRHSRSRCHHTWVEEVDCHAGLLCSMIDAVATLRAQATVVYDDGRSWTGSVRQIYVRVDANVRRLQDGVDV